MQIRVAPQAPQNLPPCFLLSLRRHSASFSKRNRRFQETNPLISFNNFNGFVQRFQWICLAIPLDLFRHSAAFVAPIRRIRRLFPAVLAVEYS